MPATFDEFFKAATGNSPYDYQRRLAGAPMEGTARSGPFPCRSQLISIPTGLGKTAAVVLAWLGNRLRSQSVTLKEPWPRRRVYCLPMRTLVEQTRDEVMRWIGNLEISAAELGLDETARAQLAWLKTHSPMILMGGEENDSARREWDIHPERPAILIGT